MSKQSERKRRAIKKAQEENKTKIQRPSWAKEFLKWRKNRPQALIEQAKKLGYLNNETTRDVREKQSTKRIKDVSKDKDSTS